MKIGYWLGLVSILISLYLVWEIRQILLLFFAAIVLATALNRIVRLLGVKWDIKRALAVPIVISSSLLIITLFSLLIIPPFLDQFQELIKLIPDVFAKVRSQLLQLQTQQAELLPPLPTWNDVSQNFQSLSTNIFNRFFAFFSNVGNVFLQISLVLVLIVMLLNNPRQYRDLVLTLFPAFYRQRADYIFDQCEIGLGNWLEGMAINCLFIGILSGIGLYFLQVKLVLVHALLAGLLNLIPNIGPTFSMIFPIMIALLDAPWKVIPIIILYIVVQNLESYWFSPMIMSKQVSLLPAVTLASQIFFASIFGLLGLLLALPLTVVAKTWIDEMLFIDILDQWQN